MAEIYNLIQVNEPLEVAHAEDGANLKVATFISERAAPGGRELLSTGSIRNCTDLISAFVTEESQRRPDMGSHIFYTMGVNYIRNDSSVNFRVMWKHTSNGTHKAYVTVLYR